MRRLPYWKTNLRSYFDLIEVERTPFEIGKFDCMLFGAGGVEAQTGIDLAADFRGKYSTIEGGKALLKAEGHEDELSLVGSYLSPIHPSEAAYGDLIAVEGIGGEPSFGFVTGANCYILTPRGLGVVRRGRALMAWSIG